MNIKRYDGQCVRIIDSNGDAFDGICLFFDADYNEHEYGRYEESLKIENFLFFRSDIAAIQSLEGHEGVYGRFLDPFGKLEEMNAEDGIDSIEDQLFSEENEHVLRMLNCLGEYLAPQRGHELPDRRQVLDVLRKLAAYNDDERVQKETKRLLARWG